MCLSFNLKAQKINVLPAQVTAESGVEDGSRLFDEQTIAGDPKAASGGTCSVTWQPGWAGLPHHAYVDLGQNYSLTDVYLYDLNGTSTFTVSTGTPGNWSLLFTDNMAGWQTWNAHPVTTTTRYLRFSTPDGDCRAYEVVLYGSPQGGGADSIAPAGISNLSVGTITSSGIQLNWTSSGDDSIAGTAAQFDIRYSTSPIITNNDFINATQVSGEPLPLIAGSSQSMMVTGLTPSTTYYFAMKTADEVPNFSGLSNVVQGTTAISTGLPPLSKIYIHLPSMDPQWNTTSVYNAVEPSDFDSYWTNLLATLPVGDGSWNGGNINLGSNGTGYGVISWNGASSSSKKPILVQLPSAGAAPGIGICPMNNNFIVCSAMNNSTGTITGPADYTTAILAIQQMIRNIQASGNASSIVYVIGKSQGGGLGMMTAGLNADVRDIFLSVPALSGYTGSAGPTGGYPGYAPTNQHGYIDAVNHAKRFRNKCTFSISYDDAVTWGRGQVTCAKNTQFTTTIHHGNDGHNDPDWWTNGTAWLDSCLLNVVNNGVGLAGSPATGIGYFWSETDHLIYPSPASEFIYLRSEWPQGQYQFVLFDLQGRELSNTIITLGDVTMLRPLAEAGTYIYEIRSVNGIQGRGKLMLR